MSQDITGGQEGAEVQEPTESRTEQIRESLEAVRERIRRATELAGRRDEPELIVVTKFHPASDVRALAELGVRAVGENRDQEARAKAQQTEDLEPPLDWHFIGQLQTNKAKYVVRYASAVHSVDRPELVDALSAALGRERRRREEQGLAPRGELDCLIQVDLDPRPLQQRPAGIGARGGVDPDQVPALARHLQDAEALTLRGVMAVAPRGLDPAESFARLAELSADLRAVSPEADWISAGMSHDLEQAVAAGATHLRIGTDVLGARSVVG